jgi:hypothetical protein
VSQIKQSLASCSLEPISMISEKPSPEAVEMIGFLLLAWEKGK